MSRVGVLVINFGEPDESTPEQVVPFLERIFLQNMGLESADPEAHRARARQLAEARAPGLIEEYRAIGGSPLNAQADRQAEALERTLRERGHDARVYSAFQFTAPFLHAALDAARGDGAERLVALPVYPVRGRSTTMAALDEVERGIEAIGWAVPWTGIAGWHTEPAYLALRADGIRRYVEKEGLDLNAPDTILHFSVHGSPLRYLELDDTTRYDDLVAAHCRDLARALGAEKYAVGFQNHTNRPIEWTQPDNEDRIRDLSETHLVVDPVSFMHEQSETLAELDHELREFVEGEGKHLHRVPVPHDDPRFPDLLATLIETALGTLEA
ncbi:MAG: ferrochelatase [Longimicrobiales bacterium]|nr:ferrochelatase [Longimicrobiales bacterium]